MGLVAMPISTEEEDQEVPPVLQCVAVPDKTAVSQTEHTQDMMAGNFGDDEENSTATPPHEPQEEEEDTDRRLIFADSLPPEDDPRSQHVTTEFGSRIFGNDT